MGNVNTASYKDNLKSTILGRSGSVIPTVNNAFDLGSASLQWKNVFAVSLTGSHFGTSSNALSSSYSVTSSFALNSPATTLVTASTYQITSSNSVSASYAVTSSFALTGPFTTLTTASTYQITSSWANFALTASFLIGDMTGSHFGTSSNAVSASYAVSSSKLTPDTNAFLQNGNSFGTTATLGTLDNTSLTIVTNQNRWFTISSTGRYGIGTNNPSAFAQVTMQNSQSLLPRTLDCEVDTSTAGTTGSYVNVTAYYGGSSVGLNDTVDITSYVAAADLFTTITGTKNYPAVYGYNVSMTYNKTGSVTASMGYYCQLNSFIKNASIATVINASGFRALIKGSGGGGIVSGSGFYCDPVVANSSSYGIFLSRNSSSATGVQYGVYQLGTDNTNFFEGPISGSGSYASYISCSTITGSGTNYSLTQTAARVDFGQGDTELLLPGAGTYVISSTVTIVGTTAGDEVRAKLRNTTNNVDIGVEPMNNISATNAKVSFYLSDIVTITGSCSASIFARNVTAARGVVSSSLTSINYIRLR